MKIKNQKVTRQLQADVQQQNSQIVFSFATQTPYLRQSEAGSYYEILKCQPQYVDDSRLKDDGCQLLLDHNWERTVGVIKNYWFENGKLYASCKFSKSQFAQGIKRDVLDLIRRNVSIGYIVKDYKVVDAIDGIKTVEVTNWEPYEVSIVSVPADINAGYLRSLDDNTIEGDGKEPQMKNAKNNKVDSTELAEQAVVEEKKTDVDLENKDLAGEDLESKSKEATEVEEETKEKELCPECNKPLDQCECEKDCGGDKEKKECSGEVEPEQKECGEMKPEEKALEPTKEQIAEALKKQFEAEAEEIKSLGEIVGDVEAAEKFVAEKRSLNQFKTYLKTKNSDKSKNSIQDNTKMEKRYFSVSKLIDAINTNKVDADSYEFKTNEENKRSLGVGEQRAIVLTKEDLKYNACMRAYGDGFNGTVSGLGTANGGDTLIQFQYRPDMYAENLRPQLTLEKTGYYDAVSPDGRPLEWPVCTSGINAGIVDLDGNLPSADMTWKNVRLQGKKIGAIAYIPYSLLTQSAPQADAKIESDLIRSLYQVRDQLAFNGKGVTSTSFEPLGILNADTNTVSTSAFTWADFVDAEVKIRESNDFSENLAWVMSPATYGELRATAKNAGNNGYVYGFICEDEKIGRYPVYCNPAIPDNKVILGNFNELVVCDFQGLEIFADPYTGLANNQVRIAGWMQIDMTLQRPKSFTVITKSE